MADIAFAAAIRRIRDVDIGDLLSAELIEIEGTFSWSENVGQYQLQQWSDALECVFSQVSLFKQLPKSPNMNKLRRAFRAQNRHRRLGLAGFHQAVQAGSDFSQRQWIWAPHAYGSALLRFAKSCQSELSLGALPRPEESYTSLVLQRASGPYRQALESNIPAVRLRASTKLTEFGRDQAEERERLAAAARELESLEAKMQQSPERRQRLHLSSQTLPMLEGRLNALMRAEAEASQEESLKSVWGEIAVARTRLHRVDAILATLRKKSPDDAFSEGQSSPGHSV